MKSKDVKELMREELAQKFNSALESGDAEQVAQAFADMADNIQQEVRSEEHTSELQSPVPI